MKLVTRHEHTLQAKSDISESYSPLAAGYETLSKSIRETAESRAESVKALMNVVADSYDEVLAEHAEEYLSDELNDAEFPQDLNRLLAVALDLQGLSPMAACKRIRYVSGRLLQDFSWTRD